MIAVAAQAQILVRDGQSDYRIVSSLDASASEKFAAEELQKHFHRCTGVELPVVTKRPAASPMIVLGWVLKGIATVAVYSDADARMPFVWDCSHSSLLRPWSWPSGAMRSGLQVLPESGVQRRCTR